MNATAVQTGAARAGASYKWVILSAVFVVQMLAIGSTSFGFGLFVKPVAAEFGLSRSVVNFGLMLLIVGMAFASPLVGRALDRFPARWTMLIGALLFGLGALLVATAQNLWLLAGAMFVPLAIGTAILGPLSASTLVARWFDEKRGRALGIVSISMSVGGMLIVPVMALLIEHHGWRWAVGLTGIGVAAITALLSLFAIRERSYPTSAAAMASTGGEQRWTARQLLTTLDFWLLVTALGLLLAMSQALLSSLVAYGTDRGLSIAQATALISAVSASSIMGKLLIGFLADIVDKRLLLAAVAVLLEIFLGMLLLAPAFPVLIVSCLVAGAAIGGTTPAWTAIISGRFGVTSFGTVMGLMVPLQMPLLLVGLHFIGSSYDRTGSYQQAFALFTALGPVAFIAALLIGRPAFRKL